MEGENKKPRLAPVLAWRVIAELLSSDNKKVRTTERSLVSPLEWLPGTGYGSSLRELVGGHLLLSRD